MSLASSREAFSSDKQGESKENIYVKLKVTLSKNFSRDLRSAKTFKGYVLQYLFIVDAKFSIQVCFNCYQLGKIELFLHHCVLLGPHEDPLPFKLNIVVPLVKYLVTHVTLQL